MLRRSFPILCLLVAGIVPVQADSFVVNDKKAPEGRKDLELIQKALVSVLEKTRGSTVCIDTGDGSGSGVIVSPDGLVLTAAHVSAATGKDVTVILEDGKRLKAESLGLVASTDCAMIRILEKGSYPFAELDRTDSAKLGDWVFALGHAGGFDKERGSVVRLGRIVRTAESTLQSDCTLIGGDSGGPLFDLHGHLIGIHSRVGEVLAQNMHVPVREFLAHWDELTRGDFVGEGPFAKRPEKGKGFLGLATEARPEGGLKITKVGRESPAERAGLVEGDVLLKLNGKELKSRDELQNLLKEMAAGDRLVLDVLRHGKPETLTLKLGEKS
ncbi:MAG TPA: trypsin-like peptidase domain-containing protein [Luteolibacter sp.]